jgi:hypothetical protein
MLERYLIPLAPYVLLAVVCLVALAVLASVESDIRRLKSRLGARHAAEESSTRDLRLQLAELGERLRDADERTGMLAPPVPPRSGLNLSRRSQVLRMARRGERPENIAASLSLPRREVELLLKVHALSAGAGQPTA